MAIVMKIKYVDQLQNGVLRFRRRFPKDVAEVIEQGFLQVHIRNRSGLPFQREYAAILQDFDRIVEETRAKATDNDTRSPFARWHEALLKVEGLVVETKGLEDDPEFARHLIAEGLSGKKGVDPLLIKALKNPESDAPKATVRDASNLYVKDKGLDNDAVIRHERILRRLEDALGSLDGLPLEDLRRDHARRYMDLILNTVSPQTKKPLAVKTCQREASIIAAMITHGLVEFDLRDKVSNPFDKLPWPKEAVRALDKKLPLPDDLVVAVEDRLKRGRTKELPLIWRILTGTGARLGEIAGLMVEDLVLQGEVPHVRIRPNNVRTLKTASSTRSVPLVGDALEAAKEARDGLQEGGPLFARYARSRGADSASGAIMKAVRQETDDERLTTHGLRHRITDKLRDAGAPEVVRHGFTGHAMEAVAETTYGSPMARLREFQKWAIEAGL